MTPEFLRHIFVIMDLLTHEVSQTSFMLFCEHYSDGQ